LYRLIGANDSVLIEILVGRTEKDISIIKAGYYAKYTKELEEDIKEHIHGDLKTLFLAILAVCYIYFFYIIIYYFYLKREKLG